MSLHGLLRNSVASWWCACETEVSSRELARLGACGRLDPNPKSAIMIQESFKGKEPSKSINHDGTVEYGAAVRGAILIGEVSSQVHDNAKHPSLAATLPGRSTDWNARTSSYSVTAR